MLNRKNLLLIALGLGLWWAYRVYGVYYTPLPFGSTDLTPILSQLDNLPADEYGLVFAYVKRSNGDVLPPSMVDPKDPYRFTARNVADAIKLQKEFLVAEEKQAARQKAFEAMREEALAPLRAVLALASAKRAIVPRAELVLPPEALQVTRAKTPNSSLIDKTPVFITSYEVKNQSNRAIVFFEATASFFRKQDKPTEFNKIASCFLSGLPNNLQVLAPQAMTSFRCGNVRNEASAKDRAVVAMPDSEVVVKWEPRLIRFEDGEELKMIEPKPLPVEY
ncbi:hypothetical protein BegalDRAFT_1847 [Beggiatoa alba B18LD]|uniref:Uncharacterized protein n=1 Tax=Beggiatoa alba B18LD TaxID=395493 RepID=I3CGH8_9GAMM|nr:hypothetical protein [Beggiatoa alba]EIJ42721.1 hypothetical protein BegalDRAFT_1847 [Beggiatoa alba B18LD]